jgi:SAM-dependent methyltransferase
MLFDEPFYQAINEARWKALQVLLAIADEHTGRINDVLDLGCGPGWFAARLTDSGRRVRGLDGRADLVAEARLRAPLASFEVFDFDAAAMDAAPGQADAVLCFGLLYHLENPLRALRMCRTMARRVLFLETMTLPEDGATARLVPENPNETQGVRPLALLMTPDAVAHGLLAAGFAHLYRYDGAALGHDDFVDAPSRRRRRDMFMACDVPVDAPSLVPFTPNPLSRYKFTR